MDSVEKYVLNELMSQLYCRLGPLNLNKVSKTILRTNQNFGCATAISILLFDNFTLVCVRVPVLKYILLLWKIFSQSMVKFFQIRSVSQHRKGGHPRWKWWALGWNATPGNYVQNLDRIFHKLIAFLHNHTSLLINYFYLRYTWRLYLKHYTFYKSSL